MVNKFPILRALRWANVLAVELWRVGEFSKEHGSFVFRVKMSTVSDWPSHINKWPFIKKTPPYKPHKLKFSSLKIEAVCALENSASSISDNTQ
jgi:hypothetical protein